MVRRLGDLQGLGERMVERRVRDLLREALRKPQERARSFPLWHAAKRQGSRGANQSDDSDGPKGLQDAGGTVQLPGLSEGELDPAHASSGSGRIGLSARDQNLSRTASVPECDH